MIGSHRAAMNVMLALPLTVRDTTARIHALRDGLWSLAAKYRHNAWTYTAKPGSLFHISVIVDNCFAFSRRAIHSQQRQKEGIQRLSSA